MIARVPFRLEWNISFYRTAVVALFTSLFYRSEPTGIPFSLLAPSSLSNPSFTQLLYVSPPRHWHQQCSAVSSLLPRLIFISNPYRGLYSRPGRPECGAIFSSNCEFLTLAEPKIGTPVARPSCLQSEASPPRSRLRKKNKRERRDFCSINQDPTNKVIQVYDSSSFNYPSLREFLTNIMSLVYGVPGPWDSMCLKIGFKVSNN